MGKPTDLEAAQLKADQQIVDDIIKIQETSIEEWKRIDERKFMIRENLPESGYGYHKSRKKSNKKYVKRKKSKNGRNKKG